MPDWVLHWGLLGLVVYGVISAYVPVFNAEGVAIALDDTDDDGSRAADELGFDLGRRPGGAMASTVDEI